MSATDELRRLLDERGVEYEARTSPRGRIWTYWDTFNGHRVYAMDNENGTVEIFGEWDVTPEQAIAATLGPWTCHDTGESRIFHCSECDLGLDDVFIDDEERYSFADFPRFCPFCGAKVVEPTTNGVDAEVGE